ncbi:MAG: response regulator [Thermodesulfobacteriota bacterium]
MAPPDIHILLVEDEAAHVELIRRSLEGMPGRVRLSVASTLGEANDLLALGVPDLLICDYLLPDGKGTDLLPNSKGAAPYPVLIMTSHGSETVAVTTMKSGALDYLVKSEATLAAMPRIVERTLREWGHILEYRQAEARVKLNLERLEALLSLSQTPWSSERELIEASLEEGVRLTGSDGGYLHFLDEDAGTAALYAWSREVKKACQVQEPSHYPLARAGIWADSARRREPVIHNDYSSESSRHGLPPGHFPVQRHLSVPIRDGDRIVGICGVGNKKTPYDEADVLQLSLFMNSMWSILTRLRMENELRQSKQAWENTFDAIGDVVTILDREMRIVKANQATCRLLGQDLGGIVGQHCYQAFRMGDAPCLGCAGRRAIAEHHFLTAEVYHRNLQRFFLLSFSPIFDEHHQFTGVVHTAKDITELKGLEGQIRHMQKMEALGTLAGGIAHDMNNILTPIMGYAEIVQSQLPKGSRLWANQGEILAAGLRAKELVKQILTISRQGESEKRPIRIQPIVKETLKLIRSSIPTTISIEQAIDPDCGPIMADPTQIHQVLMNLCTNAYQAMREKGGVLAVSLAEKELGPADAKTQFQLEPGEYVCLAISDTGSGIPPEIRERIFEPYFSTKKDAQGTGLGLAVVHGIVQSHRGHISVYSEPGKGSTFRIYLPRIHDQVDSQQAALAPGIPGGSERILLVDDEEPIMEMERQILEELGYRVTAFSNSPDALAEFLAHPDRYDLVITDMTMPSLTGAELAQRMLAARAGLPIVLCTGFSELIDGEKARRQGIKAFLMKPVSIRELATVMRELLEGK